MVSLAQYNINNVALAATAGLSLTPIARAFNALRHNQPIESMLPSLTPPTATSELSALLLNGYLGDFLAWAGEKLAGVGSDLFPVM